MCDWLPDWSGDVVAVVASGSSATQEAVDALRGKCRVAVVNNSYRLAPWADLLYATDERWWSIYDAAKEFAGLKVTSAVNAAKVHKLKLAYLTGNIDTDNDRFELDPKGTIGRGGNSGFQLANIVTQSGCKRQIWIGFDFCGTHWHEDHPRPLKNPQQRTLDKWCKRLDAQAALLDGLGISVRVASDCSALKAYQKVPDVKAAMREYGL